MIDDAIRQRIAEAESWSVKYQDVLYEDARQVDGHWYYRDGLTREYREITCQEHVIPLAKNPPKESAG